MSVRLVIDQHVATVTLAGRKRSTPWTSPPKPNCNACGPNSNMAATCASWF